MRLRTITCVLACLGPAAAAGAHGDVETAGACSGDAYTLFASGRFLEAASAAASDVGSADCQALAAKSFAAAAYLADDRGDARAWTEEAREHAEAAVALDGEHVEGRLQLALALWLESRSVGDWEAFREGMPQRSRSLIEAAASDAPEHAEVYALLGAWHFEALRRGGGFARRMLGANVREGEHAFDRAQALDPRDAAIAVQIGLSYLSLDPERYGDKAARALTRAVALPAEDAFDAALQERARDALRLIETRNEAALDVKLASWFGG